MGLFARLWDFCLHFPLFYTVTNDQSPLDLPENALVPDGCVNSPKNRSCWFGNFDISTDYEVITPDTGKVREYTLVIGNSVIAPDGYLFPAMLINGTYPGPTIEADWGDTLRVTVHNNLTNYNGTSIHWHGIRQWNSVWQDGVTGVTQCPIPVPIGRTNLEPLSMGLPGITAISVCNIRMASWVSGYPFNKLMCRALALPATKIWRGTDSRGGQLGPIKINGPTIINYDVDIGPILLTDWYHQDAFELYHEELDGTLPDPSSYLLNGKGRYYCCSKTDPNCTGKTPSLQSISFEKGTIYKLSIVNTATDTHFTFWIDGHNFSIVGTDFVPIRPYYTDTINIAIGQRYDIIVEADADTTKGTDFWIHARDCTGIVQPSTLGIIRYQPASTIEPPIPPPSRLCYGCEDEPRESMRPVVERHVGSSSNDFEDQYLFAGLQNWPNPNITSDLHKWILANSTLQIDWEFPTITMITTVNEPTCEKLAPKFPDQYAPICLDTNINTGNWVYFLIQSTLSGEEKRLYTYKIHTSHPIHLHGHDFTILDQKTTPWNESEFHPNLENPTRRDVVMLPVNGYVVIAFRVDNPGPWLMHCHIAWHASSGLAAQFIEQADKVRPLMVKAGVYADVDDLCRVWGDWYQNHSIPMNATQEDSGI
ncbi:MAG: hypothetical protein M1840_007703 [Geoglossum simile]|nr:MAG: hypothetical protein M1840_007703 [Geoglossum simile]